jgi:multidrug efflux system membrane fusion protein
MISSPRCGWLAAALLALAGCETKSPKAVETPPPVVLVAYPVERDVTDHQDFTARTQAVQSVDIKARVTGYLTKINFVDGGDVKKDQVLFEIDDRPYKAALDQAKASIEYAKASLVKSQADYDIALAIKKDNPAALSQQDLNKSLGARDEAKGSLDQAKANLETAQLNFDWCKVASPLDGRANTHFVDVGNLVTQDNTTLTNIVSIRPMWAYFDVDENTVLKVRTLIEEGKLKRVEGTAVPIDMAIGSAKTFDFQGTIDFVSNQLDPNTGTIRVRAVFPNKDAYLAAGMFGRIRVPIGVAHKALLVNDRAIGANQSQKYVMVVDADNKVELRIVDVGQIHEGLREVFATRTVTEEDAQGKKSQKEVVILKATDRIIVDGLQRARPGTVVAPTLVDMTTLLVAPKTAK